MEGTARAPSIRPPLLLASGGCPVCLKVPWAKKTSVPTEERKMPKALLESQSCHCLPFGAWPTPGRQDVAAPSLPGKRKAWGMGAGAASWSPGDEISRCLQLSGFRLLGVGAQPSALPGCGVGISASSCRRRHGGACGLGLGSTSLVPTQPSSLGLGACREGPVQGLGRRWTVPPGWEKVLKSQPWYIKGPVEAGRAAVEQ